MLHSTFVMKYVLSLSSVQLLLILIFLLKQRIMHRQQINERVRELSEEDIQEIQEYLQYYCMRKITRTLDQILL